MKKLFGIVLTIATSTALFAASVAQARPAYSQRCWLATKKGPYTSFEITYDIKVGDPAIKTAKISFILSKETGSAGEKGQLSDVDLNVDYDQSEISMMFDYNDWATTTVNLAPDDDGVGAFVDFASDGPTIRSFYRCSRFPMDLN